MKLPVSVLVVIHTPALEILLIERARRPGYWQSVTGSLDTLSEPPGAAALRELAEETGLGPSDGKLRAWPVVSTFEIFPEWRHRFPPGTTHNREHMFSFELPSPRPVRLAPGEHSAQRWLPWREAVALCFSWSNRDAIRLVAVSRRA